LPAKKILIPVPFYGFDPTEAAVPWKILSREGFTVVFATPEGSKASADRLMLTGERLGIWKPLLRARKDAVEAYGEMERDEAFSNPVRYADARAQDFDALLLPGGHDKGVREYLESEVLHSLVVDFFAAGKPVAAVCHGVVLAARSIDPETNKSVIHDYRTTSLLKSQELSAYRLTRYWLDDYYLTYPGLAVEDEVRSVLSDQGNFVRGSFPFFRDSLKHVARGFVVRDRNFLSARWPGDIYRFSLTFRSMLKENKR
jgi:protease I